MTKLLLVYILLHAAGIINMYWTWFEHKNTIQARGWTLDKCKPIGASTDILIYLTPFIGLAACEMCSDILEQLSRVTKTEDAYVESNSIFGFTATYSEGD